MSDVCGAVARSRVCLLFMESSKQIFERMSKQIPRSLSPFAWLLCHRKPPSPALAYPGVLCWQASTQASMKLGESLPSRQYLGNSRAYWQHTNALRCKVYICSSHHQIVIWIWFWFWDLLAKPNQYTNRQCCLSFHYKKNKLWSRK